MKNKNDSNNPADKSSAISILVAGSIDKHGHIYSRLTGTNDYKIYITDDYVKTVEYIDIFKPDVILINALADKRNAFELSNKIKQMSCESRQIYPIIFLVNQGENEFIECLKNGGDDCHALPDNIELLIAKIEKNYKNKKSMEYITLQNRELVYNYESFVSSMEIAEKIISNISRANDLSNANINYKTSPMEMLNGDLVLYAKSPSGIESFLIADFTGHGLGAAIGGMIVSDIFYTMNGKEESLENIVYELNCKLNRILPTGKFMAVCMIDIMQDYSSINVFNAGLPDVLIRSRQPGIERRIQSEHIPLGIQKSGDMPFITKKYQINRGDRIFIYTDGLIEAQNMAGEIYGSARLERCFTDVIDSGELFKTILEDNKVFCGNAGQTDDITLLEIICNNNN